MPTETTAQAGKNGYLSVRLAPDSAKYVSELLAEAGLENTIAPEKLHATLFYAPAGLPDAVHDTVDPEASYLAFTKGAPRIMGNDPWRALVVELDSAGLEQRHEQIKADTGGEHSYPDYLPHLSLKYSPEPGDLEKVEGLLDGMVLRFTDERCKDISED